MIEILHTPAFSLAGMVTLFVIIGIVAWMVYLTRPRQPRTPAKEPFDLLVYTAPRQMVAAIDNTPVTLYEGDKIVEHKYGRTVVRWLDFDRLVESGEVVRHAEADDGDWFKGYRARSLFAIEAQQACD